MSCTSLKCRSSFCATRSSSRDTRANRPRPSFAIGCGVRAPDTTSSPCAFTRKSPFRTFSPVLQSRVKATPVPRSEEHTSELQSRLHLVCRLLLEKKKKNHVTQPLPPPATDRDETI